ncbi:hypothetical protein QSH57_004211 [Fusarium oxysporum f. sp. vasinfectum]|nr:hypothetical protein QSH57_004211 [Fusarium oxysporum f. sp. vasinfectum]
MAVPGKFLYQVCLRTSLPKANACIIAIYGLGGHAFGCFKERGGDDMWLRDSVPYDLKREDAPRPMARVMIYGYKSNVHDSNSFQDFDDLAR